MLTTQITILDSKSSPATSSIKYAFDHKILDQANIKEIEFIDFMTGRIILEKNLRQFYTNPVWEKIHLDLLHNYSLSIEVSNPIINNNIIYLINNSIEHLKTLYSFNYSIEIINYFSEKNI